MEQGLSLRAPLGAASTCKSVKDVNAHNRFLRPRISALLVGAHVLQLTTSARFSAAVLLHRYYAAAGYHDNDDTTDTTTSSRSCLNNSDDDNFIVAACLFLSSKREEEPRRLRDVISVAHMVKANTTNENSLTTDQAVLLLRFDPTPPALDATYWKSKERIILIEQRILRWLAFDVAVSYPHRAAVLLVQDLGKHALFPAINRQALLRTALQCLNGAIFSATCLQQPVLCLAVAAISVAATELALKNSSCPLAMEDCWWAPFVTVDTAQVQAAVASLQAVQSDLALIGRKIGDLEELS